MKDPTVSFFKTAKQCSLSKEEKVLIAEKIGIRVREKPVKRPLGMTSTVFLKKMKAVSLSPSERAVIREWLMDAMEKKRQQHWWLHPLKHMTSITAGVLIVTITSGSLSYAAENALPGDVLYPLKVNVNETVRGALKKTSKDQAVWEAEKAERRLKEAEMMNVRTDMTIEQQAQIQKRFRRHAEALRTHIANMPAPVAVEIGQEFEAKLRAHSHALERINALHPHRRERMQKLLTDVQNERMMVEEHLIATVVSADEVDAHPNIESAMAERQELRRSIAHEVLANLPPSPEGATIMNQTAPVMMKAMPMMEADSAQNTLYDDEDMRDIAFSIEAKMRVTKRRLKELRDTMDHPDQPAPSDIEIRMMGAEQILNVAKSQMENGNIDDALRASDMALRHAEKARKEGEKRMKRE